MQIIILKVFISKYKGMVYLKKIVFIIICVIIVIALGIITGI